MSKYANKQIKPDLLTLASLIDTIIGILGLFLGIFMVSSLPSIQDNSFFLNHMGFSNEFMTLMMTFMIYGLLIISVPLIIAGIGLYMEYQWARILHILSWIPALLMFPLGTIIAIFSIWIVLTQDVSKFFQTSS